MGKSLENFERFGPCTRVAREGRVALVEFDRGDGLNALSVAAMLELTALANSFEDDLETTAIVLTGTSTYFSAGADLKDPALAERPTGLLHRRHAQKTGPNMCAAWERLEQVTIAAVEGFCIGGGSALVAACDIRVAGRDAKFRLPEIPLGMNMSWQSNPRLVNLMGPAKAKLFTILGEALPAPKALEWGLIEELVDAGTAREAALDLAARFGALPPVAVRMSKQSIDVAAKALNHATTYMDRDQFILASTSKDQSEAIAAFLEKREPKFTGE
jgi:enoyl-CoA hydratase